MVRTGDGLSSEKSFAYYIQCIQYPDNKNARNQNHSKQKSAYTAVSEIFICLTCISVCFQH